MNDTCAYCRRVRNDLANSCPGCGANEYMEKRRLNIMPPLTVNIHSTLIDPSNEGLIIKMAERMNQFNTVLQ